MSYETCVRAESVTHCETCGQRLPIPSPLDQALEQLRQCGPMVGSPLWFRNQTGHATGCVICGGDLPVYRVYRNGYKRVHGGRLTCSNACRQRAYRLRRNAA